MFLIRLPMALAPLVLLALLSYHYDGCLAASIPSLLIRGSTTVRKNFISYLFIVSV